MPSRIFYFCTYFSASARPRVCEECFIDNIVDLLSISPYVYSNLVYRFMYDMLYCLHQHMCLNQIKRHGYNFELSIQSYILNFT